MARNEDNYRVPQSLQWIGFGLAIGTTVSIGLGMAFGSMLMGTGFGSLTGVLFAIVLANAQRWDESGHVWNSDQPTHRTANHRTRR